VQSLLWHAATALGVLLLARRLLPAAAVPPGIVAHRDFGKHADGRYPLVFVANNAKLRETGVKDTIL
jgi:hypothetical protein